MASNFSGAELTQRIGELNRTPATICEFEWRIPDFLCLPDEGGQVYFSPLFSLAGASCVLAILPNGDVENNSFGFVGLALVRKNSVPPISLEVSFGFKTSDGKEDRSRYEVKDMSDDEAKIYVANRCLLRAELLERKSELLISNVFTVLCTIKHKKSTKDAGKLCVLRLVVFHIKLNLCKQK